MAFVGSALAGFFGSLGVVVFLLGGEYGLWPLIVFELIGVAALVLVYAVTLVPLRSLKSRLALVALVGGGVTVGLLCTNALYERYVENAANAGGCINGAYIGTCPR
jgi:hypothetical protein